MWWKGCRRSGRSGARSRWFDTIADRHVDRAGLPAEEQIVEAVPGLAHHDERPVGGRGRPELPCHVELRRRPAPHPARQAPSAPPTLGSVPASSPEPAGASPMPGSPRRWWCAASGPAWARRVRALVVELLALLDVAAVLEEHPGHRGDDAGRSQRRRTSRRTRGRPGCLAAALVGWRAWAASWAALLSGGILDGGQAAAGHRVRHVTSFGELWCECCNGARQAQLSGRASLLGMRHCMAR